MVGENGAILVAPRAARKRHGPAARLNISGAGAVQSAMVKSVAGVCLLACCTSAWAAPPPQLVVLTPTGATASGLPVLARVPEGETGRVLARGFSGRLLRLYALEQEYLRRETGRASEPAYLLLSNQQGGYPRFGFVLDGTPKPDAGYVDLHRSSPVAGRFGAMDQIFPHELLHVIVRQLAGEPRESGANQVHAIAVRTDPVTAFQEGFAEHVQIMCVDDPDALPATRALASDGETRARAGQEIATYGRTVGSRSFLGSPSELRFLLWFSSSEQVLRYHAVKANLFAREAPLPERLLRKRDKYAAYLFESVVPGEPGGRSKPAGVLLSTEGVIAHLFWAWVTDPALQHRYRSEDFYERFGVTSSAVDPLENAYLKIFHALRTGRPGDTITFLRAYLAQFPDEAVLVQQAVTTALAGGDIPDAPEIWLANPALQTGTSLFDQFRALPRVHTFDANAASMLDWLAVPGVTPDTARRLLRGVPYRSLEALTGQAAVDASLRRQLAAMDAAMAELRRAPDSGESLSLWAVVRPYLWRLLAYLALASALGAAAVHRLAGARWRWAVPCGLLSAVLVFACSWVVISPAWVPPAAPLLAGGLPSAAWALFRRRSWKGAMRAAASWAIAAVPALVLSASWW
jgi:hypothetical protein